MQKLRDAFVVVVGLGGVGSHVALSLIRSGVGHIRLIDFDQVSLSSLNRHAVATLEDVGRPKVVVCQEHFRGIAPWVKIQAWVEIFNESEAPRLFSPFRVPGTRSHPASEVAPTYVIDCIDNLNTKVGLLAYCHDHGIKVFSSMGAGAKCDPTRICIGDLTFTEEDPLAKSVRRRLRERGIPKIAPVAKGEAAKPTKKPGKLQKQSEKAAESHSAATPPRKESFAAAIETRSTQATPRPATSEWKADAKARGEAESNKDAAIPSQSRRPSHSHRLSRASSSSSFGSGEGAFFTPEGTPREEGKSWDETMKEQPPKLDLQAEQTSSSTPGELRRLDSNEHGLRRPSFGPERSSSGLISLQASPLVEKNENDVQPAGEYTIESTPGFTPTLNNQDVSDEERRRATDLWKRETSRRLSMGPDAEPHRVDGSNPALANSTPHSKEATGGAVQPKAATRGERGVSKAATEAPGQSESEDKSSSPSPPWTDSNPRYLIPCIFSTEKPSAQLLPLDEAELAKDGGAEMLRALEDGNEWRVRTLPVLGPLPAIFGLSIAAFVICDMAGKENLMEPLQTKIRRRSAEKTLKDLEALEANNPPLLSSSGPRNRNQVKGRECPFLLDDVLYLITEVFRNRSVVPPHVSVANSSLVRWDSTLPLSYQNVALLTREQARKHTQEVLKKGKSPVEVWGNEAAEHWRKRMEDERWYSRFR